MTDKQAGLPGPADFGKISQYGAAGYGVLCTRMMLSHGAGVPCHMPKGPSLLRGYTVYFQR